MSSEKFIETISPVLKNGIIVLDPSNVEAANKAGGFNDGFAISVDRPTNSKWVNPAPLIVILIDALKRQQEINAQQEKRIEELSNLVLSNGASLGQFTDMFRAITMEEEVTGSAEPSA